MLIHIVYFRVLKCINNKLKFMVLLLITLLSFFVIVKIMFSGRGVVRK